MRAAAEKDKLAIGLLFLGVGLAILATFLPVIQVSGQTGAVTMTTWDVLPWFAKVKFVALALLMAAAFVTSLRKWRLLIAVIAVIMVFLPALSSFLSALYAWGTLRADLVRLSGQRSPFVNPGIANLALVAAAMLVSYAVWRLETLGQASETQAAETQVAEPRDGMAEA